MSGEMARNIRDRIEVDLISEIAGTMHWPCGFYWPVSALSRKAMGNHMEFVYFRDERVPIPNKSRNLPEEPHIS